MKGITKNTISNQSYADASEWAFLNNASIGLTGIFDYKEKLEVSKINDNTTRIASGVFCLNGRFIIEEHYFDLTHDSGSLGLKRYDLIIAEYVRDGESEGNDILGFRVLKGTSTSGTPIKPTLTNNDTVEQSVLCSIYIDGTTLYVQEMNKTIIPSLSFLQNVYSKNELDAILKADWKTLSLNTGWINYGTPYESPQVKKIGDRVIMKGMVKATGSGTTIATLPADYRPQATRSFIVPAAADKTHDWARVDINSSGAVVLGAKGAASYLSLDIEFEI